jgi:hypothetical protein
VPTEAHVAKWPILLTKITPKSCNESVFTDTYFICDRLRLLPPLSLVNPREGYATISGTNIFSLYSNLVLYAKINKYAARTFQPPGGKRERERAGDFGVRGSEASGFGRIWLGGDSASVSYRADGSISVSCRSLTEQVARINTNPQG